MSNKQPGTTPPPAPPAPLATSAVVESAPPKPVVPRARVDFSGNRLRLRATPIPGYHLCWVNDTNIGDYQAMGYTFVEKHEQPSSEFEDRYARGADSGSHIRRLAGKHEDGQAMYTYLMKLEDSLFQEGMDSIEKRNSQVQQSLHRTIKEGHVPGLEGQGYANSSNKFQINNTRG